MKSEFIVADMTCNHCVQTITKAVQELAATAVVQADLANHRVSVEADIAPASILEAIAGQGYDVRQA